MRNTVSLDIALDFFNGNQIGIGGLHNRLLARLMRDGKG